MYVKGERDKALALLNHLKSLINLWKDLMLAFGTYFKEAFAKERAFGLLYTLLKNKECTGQQRKKLTATRLIGSCFILINFQLRFSFIILTLASRSQCSLVGSVLAYWIRACV